MNRELNPYAILGVPTLAGDTEITSTYNQLKKRLAKGIENGIRGANVQLQQVEAAYQLLSSSSRKAEYDDMLAKDDLYMPFSIRITPSKRVVEKISEPQVIYLLLEVKPDPAIQTAKTDQDGGLNLTLVLDQSNSMKGHRLERVKVAATEIIEQLSENDFLSVVGFNDRPIVLIEAGPVENKKILISRTRMARAKGGTEILQGLRAGIQENKKNLKSERVNHIILLTDGKTYGDEEECLLLASAAARDGISISTLGLGSEWNDEFLDELASITGGASGFIKSANSVVSFMNSQVEKLSRVFTERMQLSIASDLDIDVEMVFKLRPSPQPLTSDDEITQLGGMQHERPLSALIQLQLPPNLPLGFLDVARFVVTGDVMADNRKHVVVSELGLEAANEAEYEDPPESILDALGKLTLYNMQERATQALERGDIAEATEQLQNLATRLLDMGHADLAQQTMQELNTLQATHVLSDEGRKTIKYQTRHLLAPDTLG
jgi:Ca-activated chloride channel homolog